MAAEIPGEGERQAVLVLHHLADALERLDIGAPEREDRLLGVADDEQLAGMQEDGWPRLSQSVLVLGQEEEDLVLDRIGILKFIHEDGLELALQPRPDMRVGLQQVAGAGQEAVEPDVARIEEPPPAPLGVWGAGGGSGLLPGPLTTGPTSGRPGAGRPVFRACRRGPRPPERPAGLPPPLAREEVVEDELLIGRVPRIHPRLQGIEA